MQRMQVWSPVWELRFHLPQSNQARMTQLLSQEPQLERVWALLPWKIMQDATKILHATRSNK